MNGLKVRDSKIAGKGLFTDKEFNEGDVIGIAHINDKPTGMIGRFHNHSDNPNAHSVSIGNKRYLAALRPLMKGEEITVDYRRQPELEQPEQFQKGGSSGDKFKKRLMKRYPGMQGVYGPEGENLNIVKDPNYDAASEPYSAGNIEFMFPGLPQVSYPNKEDETLPDYVYVNPSPDKYTSIYNPRGANRADIFLDMMHGMRDDQNYEALLQNFDKAVRDARGGDMQYFYEQAVANEGYTDSQEQWDENYVDGQLRAQLAPGTLGMFSHGRRDYRKERRHDSPEMRETGKDIRQYLKGKYQDGGEPKKKRFVPGTYDPMETAGYMLDIPQVTVAQQGAPWVKYMREYEKNNPMDQFINQKKKAYLRLHPGLNQKAGVTMENFPQNVLQNFEDEYEYKKNSYVTKKYGKEAGFNPSKRGEWVDELNPTFKEKFVAESKYGSKLQPSTWDRALAGLATLASPFSPDLQAELNAGMPGLTKRESREIKDANIAGIPIGGLEVFAPSTIIGQNIANATKNRGLSYGSDYKELPGAISGEYMPNVDDTDAAALDFIQMPLTVMSAAKLPLSIGQGLNTAYKTGKKVLPQAYDFAMQSRKNPLPRELANIDREQLLKFLGPKIDDNTGRFNLGVYDVKNHPNVLVKVEDPASVALAQRLDIEDMSSLVEKTKDLDPKRFSKVLKIVPGKDGKQALIMPRLEGTLASKLQPEMIDEIPNESIIQFYKDIKTLRDKDLNFDFIGDNFMYDPKTKKFKLFDFSSQLKTLGNDVSAEDMFFQDVVFGGGNKNIYGKEKAGENLKRALEEKLLQTYMNSYGNMDIDPEVFRMFDTRMKNILKDVDPKKFGGAAYL